MNMKHKIKLHCKQTWQTRIECSRQMLVPHDWHCSVDFGALFFSVFVWQLAMCNWHLLRFLWIFSLLSVLAHLLKELFQETSLFSTTRWMPSHSNFFVVHVEELRLKSYEDVLKYLNHFSNTTRFSHWL